MAKVIALIRTSTIAQEVDSQRKELIDFILHDGVKADDIIVVGCAGASAIKVDDAYLANLNEVYRLIDCGGITAVYAWAIDRIGRNEEVLFIFKNRLIAANVQLVIKNPSLRLLNEDGTVNSGVELAFSLFATMAKQEMESKKARFHRAKIRNATRGKYNGGKIHYGYCVDDNGNIVVNEEEAKVVKTIYELYASGQYSTTQLTKELQARGITVRGKVVRLHFVTNMLKTTAFVGHTIFNGVTRKYPRIISNELFAKVQQQLKANNKGSGSRTTKELHLASKLIVCPNCGRHWFASSNSYICIGHRYHGTGLQEVETCENGETISIEWIDVAAFYVAKSREIDYIYNFTDSKAQEANEQIEVNLKKIEVIKGKIEDIAAKRKRIGVLYADAIIDNEEYATKIANTKVEAAQYESQIVALEEANENLRQIAEYDNALIHLGNLPLRGIDDQVEENFRLTHKWLKSIVVTNIEGTTTKKIVITDVLNNEWVLVYSPKAKVKINGHIMKLAIVNDDGTTTPLIAYRDFVQCANFG